MLRKLRTGPMTMSLEENAGQKSQQKNGQSKSLKLRGSPNIWEMNLTRQNCTT